MRVIGLDPGITGGYASWDGETLAVLPVPSFKSKSRGREIDWVTLAEQFALFMSDADHAYIEKVNARPHDGGSAGFKFGYVTGGQRAIISSSMIPVTEVPPHTWKMNMGLSQDKNASFAKAKEKFPAYRHLFERKSDEGVAEASLIAYYGWCKLLGEDLE